MSSKLQNADDGRLSKLETEFNARHKRWKVAPDGPVQRAAFRKMNQITDRILEERAHGIEGMRIKLRTWMEWYGDSEFPEDATALIVSLAADLDLCEEAARCVKNPGDCGTRRSPKVAA